MSSDHRRKLGDDVQVFCLTQVVPAFLECCPFDEIHDHEASAPEKDAFRFDVKNTMNLRHWD